MSYPLTSANLRGLTDLTQRVTLNLNTERGWFIDLGVSAGGSGWRVISDATSFYGTVAFSTMLPGLASNPCEPGGNNRVYAVDLGSGQSRLLEGDTTVAYASRLKGVITDLRFFSRSATAADGAGTGGATGRVELVGASDTEAPKVFKGNFGLSGAIKRVNWREVLLND
jgi:type IV pilus assembly protein PilY1